MGDPVYSHSGQRIPVRMRDGAPVCPDPACDETMVEVDPGMWRCPDAIAADRAISDGLAALRDRVDGATGRRR